ncbi:MAG: DUF1192 domain-containing protein [Micavibrio aeruginosavorus]|uniref:DUF1192 domain-containing protein n=1 Tax=Micavibrio aeruginosavorus TaxID=349221 RepID=A0A7T5R1I0_9BACT|nr:MAG: DUF1192 domain-containing protein [Micavibrio aeruginosavorus]
MFDDDLEPSTKKTKLRNLDNMSVEELKEYIEAMKAEIARVEAEISKKQKHMDAAASLFKS